MKSKANGRRYVCDRLVDYRLIVGRSDGGPLDGAIDRFSADADLLNFLARFLVERDGVVRIVREAHPFFDRVDEKRERDRTSRDMTLSAERDDARKQVVRITRDFGESDF